MEVKNSDHVYKIRVNIKFHFVSRQNFLTQFISYREQTYLANFRTLACRILSYLTFMKGKSQLSCLDR